VGPGAAPVSAAERPRRVIRRDRDGNPGVYVEAYEDKREPDPTAGDEILLFDPEDLP